ARISPCRWTAGPAGRSIATRLVSDSWSHHKAVSGGHHAVLIHAQLSIPRQRHFKPFQRPRRRAVLHFAIRAKDAAVARTMEAPVGLEVPHRAAQVRADGAGDREPLLAVAEHEDLFFRQKRGRTEGKVRRVADLEHLRRLIEHAWRQEPDHRRQADRAPRTQRQQPRGSPIQKGSSIHSNTSRSCCSSDSMVMAAVGHLWAQRAQRMHFSSSLTMALAAAGDLASNRLNPSSPWICARLTRRRQCSGQMSTQPLHRMHLEPSKMVLTWHFRQRSPSARPWASSNPSSTSAIPMRRLAGSTGMVCRGIPRKPRGISQLLKMRKRLSTVLVLFPLKYTWMDRAARCPLATASTSTRGPNATSPPAKIP